MSFNMNFSPVPASAAMAAAGSYFKGHETASNQSTEKKDKASLMRQMLIAKDQGKRLDEGQKGRMA